MAGKHPLGVTGYSASVPTGAAGATQGSHSKNFAGKKVSSPRPPQPPRAGQNQATRGRREDEQQSHQNFSTTTKSKFNTIDQYNSATQGNSTSRHNSPLKPNLMPQSTQNDFLLRNCTIYSGPNVDDAGRAVSPHGQVHEEFEEEIEESIKEEIVDGLNMSKGKKKESFKANEFKEPNMTHQNNPF